ncbi:MAG: hypothetical protein LBC88_05735 [Spirochaetaceae bacterium]|nr:hypothetical protein [Spirochaetaceae bacterium]
MMIFIGFLLISAIFFLYAYLAGNVGYFINIDSIPVIICALIFFSLCTFHWKEFIKGIKSMFIFNIKTFTGCIKTARHYKSMMFISIFAGIISTFQGLIFYFLTIHDFPEKSMEISFTTALSYASFSTVYALMISMFLLYPIYLLHNGKCNK